MLLTWSIDYTFERVVRNSYRGGNVQSKVFGRQKTNKGTNKQTALNIIALSYSSTAPDQRRIGNLLHTRVYRLPVKQIRMKTKFIWSKIRSLLKKENVMHQLNLFKMYLKSNVLVSPRESKIVSIPHMNSSI